MTSPFNPTQAVLGDGGYGALKHYIIQATGLSYYLEKDRDLAAAIVRARGTASWISATHYQGELMSADRAALDRLAEELTIGETFFFRHHEMFGALREHVLPELYQRNLPRQHLRIWSAGCSVGAEPYSLAIMLRTDLAHLFSQWNIEIIGTDINRRFLAMARAGLYENWALRGMSETMRKRCFEPKGKQWLLQERFKAGVTFQQHNLVQDRFPSLTNNLFALDLIICRNVMIYFSQETIRELADHFHRALVPGGWLAVGHAEPHTETFKAFRTINAPGAILYQRASVAHAHQPPTLPSFHMPPLPQIPERPPIVQVPSPPYQEVDSVPEVPPARAIAPVAECLDRDSVRRLADAGEFVEAQRCCRNLLAAEPLDASLHLIHGLLLEQIGEWEEALRVLRRAIYLDRRLALAHYHTGLLERRLGWEAQALRSWRNAQSLIAMSNDAEMLPFGDGMCAGDLRVLIAQQTSRARPV